MSSNPRVTDREESGFTMVELIVAMAILVSGLLGLMTIQVKALQGVDLAKQRQQATSYANRAMEQLRALPYDVVTGGLKSSDLSGDPNITGGNLRPLCNPSGVNESIVTTASASTAPLYPHVLTIPSTTTVSTSYRVSAYVTLVSTTAGDTSKGYWLTVITNWPATGSCANTRTVRTRSQLFSPSGCLATATHPFSGPCQAFYDGAAASTPAGISVSSAGETGSAPLAGNDLLSGSVSLPSLSAGVQAEETVSAHGRAATSGAQYRDTSPPDEARGGLAAATGASTDPATGEASTPASATVTQSGASPLTKSGISSTFTFSPGTSDFGKAVSTTAALASGDCKNLTDVPITSGQACSSSAITPGGTVATSLTLGATIPLGSVANAAVPSRAFTSRYLSSGGSYCTGASGTGCISANVSRAIGASAVGGIPNTAIGMPAGFTTGDSFASVTAYSDGAKAESAPSGQGTTRAGVLRYWSGAGFTSVTLGPGTAVSYTSAAPMVLTYPGSSATSITLSITNSITVTSASSTAAGASPCQPTACTMTSTSGTVVASVTYAVAANNAPVGAFTVTLNLGSASARTSYRAAPSA